ncbi:MAG TPA: ATP synthase F1 subunit epsilon [Bryobacterales bacterium]|nr:ATP synthase F1 subunit epsilon [Bryobacterales bacterium]
MVDQLTLEVAVPERRLVNEKVDEVQAPAATGYLGVLPNHAPLMTQLQVGVLSFRSAGKSRFMAIDGGVMEVLPDHVRVLADGAQWGEEVNVAEMTKAKADATKRLQDRPEGIDFDRENALLAHAQARLDAHSRTT